MNEEKTCFPHRDVRRRKINNPKKEKRKVKEDIFLSLARFFHSLSASHNHVRQRSAYACVLIVQVSAILSKRICTSRMTHTGVWKSNE